MFTVRLNPRKSNNYAFFCPVTKLHLTVRNPVGTASEVSPAILRAVKIGLLIDVDNVIDLTTGKLKTIAPVSNQEPVTQEPVQEQAQEPIVETKLEEPVQQNKRRGRKNKTEE